jgi:hypothetical protein
VKLRTAISQIEALIANFNAEIEDLDRNYIEDHPELENAIGTIDSIQDILNKIEKPGVIV